jgi:LCP family protein required for cell wall assembly
LLAPIVVACVALIVFVLALVVFPPFGAEKTARILLVGLDAKPPEGGPQRSDTIMVYAGKLNGSGAVLLSVPRDARVRLAGETHFSKINAAFAAGKAALLKSTLAQPDVLAADLPYHVIFDSATVAAMIDALGGIEVTVPREMDYDDNWGKLHIHLRPGRQHLTGTQAVGYLRWRKNNHGKGASDDFSRTERQRSLMVAVKDRVRSWQGLIRVPALYQAFRTHADTNLSFQQFVMLGWASRTLQTDAVPGSPRTLHGISYVLCDWEYARQRWQAATQ